jgi:hypothetical protein
MISWKLLLLLPGKSSVACENEFLLSLQRYSCRPDSNQVVLCTGYGRKGSSPGLIQWNPEHTIVFLMAVGRLTDLRRNCERQRTILPLHPSRPVLLLWEKWSRAAAQGPDTRDNFWFSFKLRPMYSCRRLPCRESRARYRGHGVEVLSSDVKTAKLMFKDFGA